MIEVIKRLKEANMTIETMMITTGLSYLEIQNILVNH